eukprot:13206497-Heterocapsa_arctica.AAC.1
MVPLLHGERAALLAKLAKRRRRGHAALKALVAECPPRATVVAGLRPACIAASLSLPLRFLLFLLAARRLWGGLRPPRVL